MITIEEIRTAGGFPSDLVTDSQVEQAIKITTSNIERLMNTKFEPTERIEKQFGNYQKYLFLEKNPVLKVIQLKIGDTNISPETLEISRESGRIQLTHTSESFYFFRVPERTNIRYMFGYLIEDTQIINTTPILKGIDVSFEVEDTFTLSVGDWLNLSDINGKKTISKIKAINGNEITIDESQFNFEENILIYSLKTPDFIKRLIELESVIYLAINVIGATYTFNTGYSLGDLSAQKGVPYTHWAKTTDVCIKERDNLMKKIKPRFRIV